MLQLILDICDNKIDNLCMIHLKTTLCMYVLRGYSALKVHLETYQIKHKTIKLVVSYHGD